MHVRQMFDNFAAFKAYDDRHNLHIKLGFLTAESAWGC
jgi:hypothetical protein